VRLAGRLAMHATLPEQNCAAETSAFPQLSQQMSGYHGCDVVVLDLCETGFEAEIKGLVPQGSVVRLRLPGAGMMVARVIAASEGSLRAEFVNRVSAARLRMTMGLRQPAWQSAA
jgi:hypothetical protein